MDSELSLERDDNPARAEAGEGVPAEFIQTATIRAVRSQRIDERSGWLLHGRASVRQHDRYHDLNELDLAGGVMYRIQPEVAFTAPWYEVDLTIDRSVRSRSAIRNVTSAVASLSTGANLTDRIAARAGLRFTRAVADTDSVAEQRERALDLEGDYRLGAAGTAYARWSLARGDQMFSSPVDEYGTPGIRAQASDPAFGGGFYAYRAQALTRVLEAGAFVSFVPRQGWNVWVRAIHSAAESGAAYTTRQIGVGWRYLMY